MDEAGFETAHPVGNSPGGYLALQLAARGRARSVVALAPAGGWADGDEAYRGVLEYFARMQKLLAHAAPRAEEILATPGGAPSGGSSTSRSTPRSSSSASPRAGSRREGGAATAAGHTHSRSRIRRMSGAVAPKPGQRIGPPGALTPISRCGVSDRPTIPQPTRAMGWPRATWAPTGTSAGLACP